MMRRIFQYLKRGLIYIAKGVPQTVSPVYAKVFYLTPNKVLENRKIIITGGTKGIGLAMAKKFMSEGADVLISGRNEQLLKNISDEIGCHYLYLDLNDLKSFESFIREADKILGGADCLVNNAGISLHEDSFFAVTEEQFDTQFVVNLKGPFFLTQKFMSTRFVNKLETIKKVLFISSETGTTVDERPYGLSKAALNSLVQGLAHKYVSKGFRINAIAPGVTLTDMVGGGDIYGDISYSQMTGRYYLPNEIAETACFLLTDASNSINGQIIHTNEGKTINARWK